MMKKLRIDITFEDDVPLGTGILFILAELIKDVPSISDERPMTTRQELDDGEVVARSKWLKPTP